MDIPLGRHSDYPDQYSPELLVPLSRAEARAALGLAGALPFRGEDVWNGYEFSWLDRHGVPRVACLRLAVTAASPRFVESKSFKLYLNSFAQSTFEDTAEVADRLGTDLERGFGTPVALDLLPPEALPAADDRLPGVCLDTLAAGGPDDAPTGGTITCYTRSPALLRCAPQAVRVQDRTLHTHLFRSLCPVTGQPDWASILVRYTGPEIVADALWRYLLSYRCHEAFHETTVEQIFLDLMAHCACERLLVAGFFQRRGGLDINPLRTNGPAVSLRYRLPRQ